VTKQDQNRASSGQQRPGQQHQQGQEKIATQEGPGAAPEGGQQGPGNPDARQYEEQGGGLATGPGARQSQQQGARQGQQGSHSDRGRQGG
jgi:hypothetical protein